MGFCAQNASHRSFWSASQKKDRCFGPAPRAISSPAHGLARHQAQHRNPKRSPWLPEMMQMTTQWMTPARGDPMPSPLMMMQPLPQCKLTSRPQGRAVFTLHPSTANLSWAPVPSARLSTSVAKWHAPHVGLSHSQWTKVAIQKRPTNPTGGPVSLNGECKVSLGSECLGRWAEACWQPWRKSKQTCYAENWAPGESHPWNQQSSKTAATGIDVQKRWATRTWKTDTPATSLFATASTVRGRTCRTAYSTTCSHMATSPIPQGPKLRSRLASPPMPKMRTAYLSWFSCLSLEVLMVSQLSSAKHGRRSGVSCFGRHIFTEDEYVSYIGRRGAFRGLLTWKGTVQVPFEGTRDFLEKVYEENLPLVRSNLERKEKQSAAAKAGGPGGHKADPTVAPTIERKRKAEADASATAPDVTAASSSARADASHADAPVDPNNAPFLAPEPPTSKAGARPFLEPETPPTAKAATAGVTSKAASSGRPDASWSWNRDHYGARREWSFWRGAWYYRDEAGGRWIFWNR